MFGVDGRAWIDAQPAALAAHADLLRRLLDAAQADEHVRTLELQCSVARGAGESVVLLDRDGLLRDPYRPDGGPRQARRIA